MATSSTNLRDTTGKPRCSHCGQDLTGVTEGNKCPECGGLLIDVLVREGGAGMRCKRYKSKARVMGLPAISIEFGIGPDGKQGHAKGWIAIGDRATGIVAIGGSARGIFAVGGAAIGCFTLGGFSVGLFAALGGCAIAPLGLACGGAAIGMFAVGGMAIGFASTGGFAAGYFAWGPGPGATRAVHSLFMRGGANADPAAKSFFQSMSWLFGNPSEAPAMMKAMVVAMTTILAAGAALAMPGLLAWWREKDDDTNPKSGTGAAR